VWRELILEEWPEATLFEPASDEAIARAEAALGVSFPEELVSLLRETNGVLDDTAAPAIWSCEEIASENIAFRTEEGFAELYMPFDHLLFFGADGGGDQFAYGILKGVIRKDYDIFVWDHENDSRTWWTNGLERFLRKPLRIRDDEE
jgi:hypothetical protein